jgi:hypothetical protein
MSDNRDVFALGGREPASEERRPSDGNGNQRLHLGAQQNSLRAGLFFLAVTNRFMTLG